jgi:hypothetical protein
VQGAINKNHTRDFTLLSSGQSLPFETRRYVPAIMNALREIGDESGFLALPRHAEVPWILYADPRVATNPAEFSKEMKGELK